MKDRVFEISSDVENIAGKQWETLGISNDFIFGKVMQNEELLTELIRMILPELHFAKLNIIAQKSEEMGLDIHGVRFDIFATDEAGRVIEIEMQVIDTRDLQKRSRYYGTAIDQTMLDKGVAYSRLSDSYVILICPFDPFGDGLHKYTFTNRCHEVDGLELGDGTTKIFLNADSDVDDVSKELRDFLDYVDGKDVDSDYVREVDEAVKAARMNKEWRNQYMTMLMRDLENKEIGREEGEQNALVQSIKNLMNNLKMNIDQAMDALGIPSDQRSLYAGLVNQK